MTKKSTVGYLSLPYKTIHGTPVCITNGMHILWEMSPDIQNEFSLENKKSALIFCVFCHDQMRKEYPYLAVCENEKEKKYFFGTFEEQKLYPILPYLRYLVHVRKYLKNLDLNSAKDRIRLWEYAITKTELLATQPYFIQTALTKIFIPKKKSLQLPLAVYACACQDPQVMANCSTEKDFLAWLTVASETDRPELAPLKKALALPKAFEEWLHSPENNTEMYSITPSMRILLYIRSYLAPLDLHQKKNRLKLWRHAIQNTNFLSHSTFLKTLERQTPVPGKENVLLPLGICALLFSREDVVAAFNNAEDFIQWIKQHGIHEIAGLQDVYDILYSPIAPCTSQKVHENGILNEPISNDIFYPEKKLQNGVNVLGYGFGELGIGEDSRLAIENCKENKIPASLFNIPLPITSRTGNHAYKAYIDNKLPHKVNLYCLPGPEIIRTFFSLPSESRNGRLQIFYTPWELPHFPKPLRPILNAADELWAPSRYIQTALQEATKVPVYHMPLSIQKPQQTAGKTRQDFNLPEDKYLFLLIFDWLSWPQRKNPEAVIKAFFKAFPSNNNVGLVIKTMNAGENIKKINELLTMHGIDKRITIIDSTLPPLDLFDLYQCTNAYVSLHRAEGFGRTIAEAMLAELPVIVTNFSGNTDFCTPETAFLVNGTMVPLREGDYLFPEGQYWCDPSIDEAAEQMLYCFNTPELTAQKVRAATKFLQKNHSPKVIGKKYRKRLFELGYL